MIKEKQDITKDKIARSTRSGHGSDNTLLQKFLEAGDCTKGYLFREARVSARESRVADRHGGGRGE